MTNDTDPLTQDDLTDLDKELLSSVPESESDIQSNGDGVEQHVQPLLFSLFTFATPVMVSLIISSNDMEIGSTYYGILFSASIVLIVLYGLSANLKNTKRNYRLRRVLETSFMSPFTVFLVEYLFLSERVLLLREQSVFVVPDSIIVNGFYVASFIGLLLWVYLLPDAKDTVSDTDTE